MQQTNTVNVPDQTPRSIAARAVVENAKRTGMWGKSNVEAVLDTAADKMLADATREVLATDLCEQDAAARLAKLPGAKWVYVSVNVGYRPGSTYENFDALTYNAHIDFDCGTRLMSNSKVGFLPCVEEIEHKRDLACKAKAREDMIRARVEREVAELEAAEKSLTAHATGPQHEDGVYPHTESEGAMP